MNDYRARLAQENTRTAKLAEQPRMTLFLPRDLHDKLRREAFDKRVPMSYIIRDLLELHYAKEAGA